MITTDQTIQRVQAAVDAVTADLPRVTSRSCPFCGMRAPEHSLRLEECAECGMEYDFMAAEHQILDKFLLLHDDEIAKNLTYYHWSNRVNWYDGLPSDLMVHMGGRQAVFDRMIDCTYGAAASNYEIEGYVYSLRLHEAAEFEDEFRCDVEDYTTCGDDYTDESNGLVQRYVNVIEGPGSVSLVTDKSNFIVVAMQRADEFFGQELLNSALNGIVAL